MGKVWYGEKENIKLLISMAIYENFVYLDKKKIGSDEKKIIFYQILKKTDILFFDDMGGGFMYLLKSIVYFEFFSDEFKTKKEDLFRHIFIIVIISYKKWCDNCKDFSHYRIGGDFISLEFKYFLKLSEKMVVEDYDMVVCLLKYKKRLSDFISSLNA